MPAFTTANLSPNFACSRRESTAGQRSSPFMVEPVPSVSESPKATMARVSGATFMSSASRKYQEVVLKGKPASSSSAPRGPAPGAVI